LLALLLVPATAASFLGCERVDYAWPRWVGWSALVIGFGPVCFTLHAAHLRLSMYRVGQTMFLWSVLASALWWLAGLPNLGVGDFTGIMWHSIQLGSTAALVGVMAIARITNGGSAWWYGVYGTCALVAMLASSRAALAAMAFGTLIAFALKLRRNALISSCALFFGIVIAVAPITALDVLLTAMPGEFTSGLARKSFQHSREQHWEARWEEFDSSPWTGVGFMSAWEDTMGVDPDTGAIETGSSYLALLSMTGMVGAGAMLLLVCSMAWGVFRHWHDTAEVHRVEICSMAGFWIVHLGAEGYIFAVGSLMNLMFWLWLGCLNDHFKLCHRRTRARASLSPRAMVPSLQHLGSHRAA
jgi:O-antigen ligase